MHSLETKQHEGSTASQTEEQTRVYKNLTSWRFWSVLGSLLFKNCTLKLSTGAIVEIDALEKQLEETDLSISEKKKRSALSTCGIGLLVVACY